jgi:hypothetical protein
VKLLEVKNFELFFEYTYRISMTLKEILTWRLFIFLNFDQRSQGTVYYVVELPDNASLERSKQVAKIK